MAEFKERLGDLLREKGMTKYRLSKRTGISQTTLGRWEKGVQRPGMDAVRELAKALDVSAAYLLGETDDREPERVPVTEEDIKFALFEGARDITDEMYQEVKDFAQFVKKKYGKDV